MTERNEEPEDKAGHGAGNSSRRSILLASGALLVGGIAGRMSTAEAVPEPKVAGASPLPWKWTRIDPMEAGIMPTSTGRVRERRLAGGPPMRQAQEASTPAVRVARTSAGPPGSDRAAGMDVPAIGKEDLPIDVKSSVCLFAVLCRLGKKVNRHFATQAERIEQALAHGRTAP